MAQWFGPKEVGYGIGPRSWQGWAVTAVTLAAILALRFFFHPEALGLPVWSKPAATGAIAVIFLLLAFLNYEDDPD
jgi:hypothetical protein